MSRQNRTVFQGFQVRSYGKKKKIGPAAGLSLLLPEIDQSSEQNRILHAFT